MRRRDIGATSSYGTGNVSGSVAWVLLIPPFSRTSPARASATHLVEIDGEDDRCSDENFLPERLDTFDDEAVLRHRRNKRADSAAENRADPAEEARAADHDGTDRGQVICLVRG